MLLSALREEGTLIAGLGDIYETATRVDFDEDTLLFICSHHEGYEVVMGSIRSCPPSKEVLQILLDKYAHSLRTLGLSLLPVRVLRINKLTLSMICDVCGSSMGGAA